ncbi:MAG TPA: YfhO family protein [Thermoanaerobaculia bacterium]|nr:YfhO family protein [Thermoanaerobaculia bacterium]
MSTISMVSTLLGPAVSATALYLVTACALGLLAHRFVLPMSKTAALILLLLPLCFTGRALLTGRVYSPIDFPYVAQPLLSFRADFGVTGLHNGVLSDVYSLNIPWRYAARLAILRGEWPLWNPYLAAGDLLAAAAQPTPYEPLFLISLLLPMPVSLTFLAAITFFLGGLLMFLFLREIACSERAALVGAAAWTFCGFLVFFLDWVITPANVWLPLVLLGVRRVVRTPGLRAMSILTVAFSMMLLNGHPESALHIVAVGLVWAAAELCRVRFRGMTRSIPLAISGGVLALAITAIYMFPIVEAIPQTSEHRFRENVFAHARRSGPPAEVMQRLLRQFVPFIIGEPQREWRPRPNELNVIPESMYVGSAALSLAAFGLWRSRWRGKWLVLALVLFGIAVGIQLPPFGDLLAKLPLFDIALNERLILVAALGLCIFAALGVDAVVNEPNGRRPALAALGVFLFLLALCVYLYPGMRARGLTAGYLYGAITLLLVPPILVAAACSPRRPAALGLALLVIVTGERTLQSGDLNPTLPARMFYPAVPLFSHLQHSDDPYRIVGVGDVLPPNIATMYQMEDVRQYTAMTFTANYDLQLLWSAHQPVWSNRVDDLSAPFLSLMNVRYAFAESSVLPPPHWSFVASDRGTQLLENQNVLPRAFIPRAVTIGDNPFIWEGILKENDFGARGWIVVPGESHRQEPNGSGSLTVRREGMGALSIRSHLVSNAWVVVSETAWKGWRAHVDGEPAKLRIADGMFLAMYLPAGDHDVRLTYWPRSFVVGRAISAVTLLLIGVSAAMIVLLRRRRGALRATMP